MLTLTGQTSNGQVVRHGVDDKRSSRRFTGTSIVLVIATSGSSILMGTGHPGPWKDEMRFGVERASHAMHSFFGLYTTLKIDILNM